MIKKGDILIAIQKCKMVAHSQRTALTIGKEYEVFFIKEDTLYITNDWPSTHLFSKKSNSHAYWAKFFKRKK